MNNVKKVFLIGIAMLLVLVLSVSATDYYIATNGNDNNQGTLSQPWRTISQANSELRPGDTVYIRGGSYDFNGNNAAIEPVRSGIQDNYITYKNYQNEEVIITNVVHGIHLINKNYIEVDGIKVIGCLRSDYEHCCDVPLDEKCHNVRMWVKAEHANHNIIRNCYFENGNAWSGVAFNYECNYNKLLDNTIKAGEAIAHPVEVQYDSNYNLIQGNTIVDGSHATLWIRDSYEVDGTYSRYNIVRNNTISNQFHHGLRLSNNIEYTLVENNVVHDCWGENALLNCRGSERDRNFAHHDTGALDSKGYRNILRRNVIITGGLGVSPGSTTRDLTMYHNTMYDCFRGTYSNSKQWCRNNFFKNNLVLDSKQYDLWSYYSGVEQSVPGSIPDEPNNQYFINNLFHGGGLSYQGITRSSIEQLENQFPQYFINNIDDDPLVVDKQNRDLRLTENSPAIDAGAWLTKTTSDGSGMNIPVQEAFYFTDGYGVIDGDLIQLEGQSITARITSVNYDTNTLTVDRSLSWTNGQGVSRPYSSTAPDIGAYEFDNGETPPPLEPIPGDLNNDTRVDIGDLIIVASNFGTSNSVADTDGNGIIDIFDIVYIASRLT